MTQDERIAINQAMRILQEATGDRREYQTIGDLVKAAKVQLDRLRAELAAAKAEPLRPAAILANPDGDIHAYEDMRDYLATCQPRGSWGYTVRSWTWHPKSP